MIWPSAEGVGLATTALREMWDKSRRIVLLGEWCTIYRSGAGPACHEVLPFVWKDLDTVERAIGYCEQVYARALCALTERLNVIHGTDQDQHYYRILLGNWLLYFVQIIYDRFLAITAAINYYPQLATCMLDEEQYYIPLEGNDFMRMIGFDEYNLQLYSQICRILGYNFPSRKLASPLRQSVRYTLNARFKDRCISLAGPLGSYLAAKIHDKYAVITDDCFKYSGYRNRARMSIRSGGRCVYEPMRYSIDVPVCIDRSLRDEPLAGIGEGRFETVLARLIMSELPFMYLEGYEEYRRQVRRLDLPIPALVFTQLGLYGNPILKMHVAEHFREMHVACMQHGGGYGIEKDFATERWERAVSNTFYTWGWGQDRLPMPLRVRRKPPRERGGLLVMTAMPRFVYRLGLTCASGPNYLTEYLDFTNRFLNAIDRGYPLKIRTVPGHDYEWHVRERLSDEVRREVTFEGSGRHFDQLLHDYELNIFDHAHTAYLESLALNRPTVIYISPRIYRFSESAQPFFDRLADAGILHHSPERAAGHCNEIAGDPTAWWCRSGVQEARQAFVERFANTSADWIGDWICEFSRVLRCKSVSPGRVPNMEED